MGKTRIRLGAMLAAMLLLLTACGAAEETTPAPTVPTTVPTTTTTAPATDPVTGVTVYGDPGAGQTAEGFELPLKGATGFASVDTPIYSDAGRKTKTDRILAPGDAFTVLEEVSAGTWRIRAENGDEGYVETTCCYVNVADVIPSIVLDNTNGYSSAFLSSGKEIPTITGRRLYDSKKPNPRLGKEEFLVACNVRMVRKLYAAQQAALAQGYTLVLNEAFRPMDVQLDIAAKLKALYTADAQVRAGIDKKPWGIAWFIASRPSTHQMGCAVDTSLARVNAMEYRLCGAYRYRVVTDYTLCEMPTPIHELSSAAVALSAPVNSYSPTAWKGVSPAASMTPDALRLQKYCTDAGMSPLASEWWHFNDLDTKAAVGNRYTTAPFYLDTCVSEIP